MTDQYQELSDTIKEIVSQEIWRSWSPEQRDYILTHEGQPTNEGKSRQQSLIQQHGEYHDKTWVLGTSQPNSQECCQGCRFEYCFYAKPRNWSMSATSDVWNLMKCANVNCQCYFESCL